MKRGPVVLEYAKRRSTRSRSIGTLGGIVMILPASALAFIGAGHGAVPAGVLVMIVMQGIVAGDDLSPPGPLGVWGALCFAAGWLLLLAATLPLPRPAGRVLAGIGCGLIALGMLMFALMSEDPLPTALGSLPTLGLAGWSALLVWGEGNTRGN